MKLKIEHYILCQLLSLEFMPHTNWQIIKFNQSLISFCDLLLLAHCNLTWNPQLLKYHSYEKPKSHRIFILKLFTIVFNSFFFYLASKSENISFGSLCLNLYKILSVFIIIYKNALGVSSLTALYWLLDELWKVITARKCVSLEFSVLQWQN